MGRPHTGAHGRAQLTHLFDKESLPLPATPPLRALLPLAAALLALVRPAFGDEVTFWSATLNVKTLALSGDLLGCSNDSAANAKCSNSSVLSDDDFNVHGVTYEIRRLRDDDEEVGNTQYI